MGRIVENAAGGVFIVDSHDRVVASFGAFGASGRQVVTATSAAPTAIASTTAQFLGLAAQGVPNSVITPQVTGNVFAVASGLCAVTTTDTFSVGLNYGTGTAPANAAATAGTVLDTKATVEATTGQLKLPFVLVGLATGLGLPGVGGVSALGVPVWFDVTALASGGSATCTNVTIVLVEVG